MVCKPTDLAVRASERHRLCRPKGATEQQARRGKAPIAPEFNAISPSFSSGDICFIFFPLSCADSCESNAC